MKDKDLMLFLNSFKEADSDDINKSNLNSLSQLIPKNQFIKFDIDITVNQTELNTANSVGVLLYDSSNTLSNVLVVKNNEQFTINHHVGVVSIGDGDDCFIVDDIERAINLHLNLDALNHSHRIIIAPNRLFNNVVLDFAKKQCVTIFCIMTEKNDYLKRFDGANVKLISLIDPCYNDNLFKYPSFQSFLLDADFVDTHIDCRLGEWGSLGNVKSVNQTKETPYPIHAFNYCKTAQFAIQSLAKHTKVPLAMSGQSVLAVLSHLAQRRVNAPMLNGSVPCSLWFITQGESGDGKSQVSKWASKALTDHATIQEIEYKKELKEWLEHKPSKSDKEREPKPQKPKREIVRKATTEGLQDLMLVDEIKNIFYSTAEAGGFFGSYSMKSENKLETLATYADLWSDGSFDRVLSKGGKKINQTDENMHVDNARLTLDLQGQPVMLTEFLTDDKMNEQGFLIRFLYSFPYVEPDNRKISDGDKRNQILQDNYMLDFWHTCTELLTKYPSNTIFNELGELVRTELKFDEQAQQRYNTYWNECIDRAKPDTPLYKYRAMVKRLCEQASRIATVLVYFDQRETITKADFENGILLAEYSLSERVRYGKAPENHVVSDMEKVWESLFNYCKQNQVEEVDFSYLKNKVISSKLKAKHIIDPIIEGLVDLNYIKQYKDFSQSKQGKEVIRINPILLKS